jgi:2-dehydro-3-deoxyphosphogluconate aldolase/(4S)-4-hydroxy-2-oxoglutarate aldolase
VLKNGQGQVLSGVFMASVEKLMGGQLILPLVQASSVEEGIQIVAAMKEGGLKAVEVVLRTPKSAQVLKAVKEEFSDMCVGAGTVLDAKQVSQVRDLGADFIVTPAATAPLLQALVAAGLPAVPGVASASDAMLAYQYGFREMKFFPAELAGGPKMLKALAPVFQGVRFCPTGGVSSENRADYLALDHVFCVGGSWVAPNAWVHEERWQDIAQACRAANVMPTTA